MTEQKLRSPELNPFAREGHLRAFTAGVYAFMALGLVVAGLVALGINELSIDEAGGAVSLTSLVRSILGSSTLRWMMLLSPIGIFFIIFLECKSDVSTNSGYFLFFGFAIAMGFSMSSVSIAATRNATLHQMISSGAQAFFFPAAGFAGLCCHRLITRREIAATEIFLITGLWGLTIPSLIYFSLQPFVSSLILPIVSTMVFAAILFDNSNLLAECCFEVGRRRNIMKEKIKGALLLTNACVVSFFCGLLEAGPYV